MHIPDGLLSAEVVVTTGTVSAGILTAAVVKVRRTDGDSSVPRIGVLAAFLFVAQMIQFPVAPGVSGHLLGGALAAILAGPWAAAIILTTVLVIQSLVFQDGGLIALSANIFNMSVVGVFAAHYSYRMMRNIRFLDSNKSIAIAAASFLSVIAASAGAAVQLSLSGLFALGPGLLTIVGIHMLIGLGEAAITTVSFIFISKNLPEFSHNYAG